MSKDLSIAQRALSILFRKKAPFQCRYTVKHIVDTYERKLVLVFAKGPEEAKDRDTIINFTCGFVDLSPRLTLLDFSELGGSRYHDRRVRYHIQLGDRLLISACLYHKPRCLGGRGTGAILGTRAAAEETTHSVLMGYPIQIEGGARDELLRDLPPSTKILSVSFNLDGECGEMENMRSELKCQMKNLAVPRAK